MEPFIMTAKGIAVSSAANGALWIVMTSSAHSPPDVKRSRYRNVALVQRTPGYAADNRMPLKIDLRAHGVEAVQHYGVHHVGRTDGAYQQTFAEAQRVAAKLNAAGEEK